MSGEAEARPRVRCPDCDGLGWADVVAMSGVCQRCGGLAEAPTEPQKRVGWPKGKNRKLHGPETRRFTVRVDPDTEADLAKIREQMGADSDADAIRMALHLVASGL